MAEMTLYEACKKIADTLSGVEGIAQAPQMPPEKASQFPFAVVYPRSGTFDLYAQTLKRGLHSIVVEVHVNRRDLAGDMSRLIPLLELVIDALMRLPTLDGLAHAIVMDSDQPLRYELLAMEYAGIYTVGYRIVVNIKQETSIYE